MFEDLTEENVYIFAAKCYYNPLGVDIEEFEKDLKRFQYIRRLINRYLAGYELSSRLILNHLITIFNVFGVEGGMKMIEFYLNEQHLPVIKPFLIFLRAIANDQMVGIVMDPHAIEKLREINVTAE